MTSPKPLVSFVIINFNYAEFVGTAIESVLGQEFDAFECIVLDNGSTDHSRGVLESFVGKDSRLRVNFLGENLNQIGAFLHILDELRGDYVTIVDADDFLFANYASTHVQVHQSIPGGVAFTSSCILEVDGDGQLVTSGYEAFLSDGDGIGLQDLKSDMAVAPNSVTGVAGRADILEMVRVFPADRPGWHWSPGTANMHRRELLRATRPRTERRAYVGATDNYFMWLNHAVAGSAAIDIPLSAYRIHGRNRFGSRYSICGMQHGTPAGINRSAVRRRDITRELTSRPADFAVLAPDGAFWRLMDAPASAGREDVRLYYQDPHVVKIIKANKDRLVETFGESEVRSQLLKRMGAGALRSIFHQ